MAGPRSKDDTLNIEGSGFHYRDRVVVTDSNREVEGIVEAIHANGKKLDIRIDSPGHETHERVVTFDPSEVKPHKDLVKSMKGKGAAADE